MLDLSSQLLPKRKTWLGEDIPLSYEQAVSCLFPYTAVYLFIGKRNITSLYTSGRIQVCAAPQVSTAHLAQICSALQQLLRNHGYQRLPGLNSLLGSGVTSYITTGKTRTGRSICVWSVYSSAGLQHVMSAGRGTQTVVRCISRLSELAMGGQGQHVINQCE